MQSSFFAQKPTKNVAMTVGATRILARAVERSMVNVYLTSNFANLGQPAALLDDADSERFSIGEKFKPRWVHKRSTGRGFASRSEVSPEVTAEIVSEYNAQARGWSTNIDAGDLMYLRYDIQGELIGLDGATEVYEQILIDVAGKFEEPQDEGDQEGSWAYRYPFCSLDDPNSALGAPFKITVINKLATL
jgi:hypothetical protein